MPGANSTPKAPLSRTPFLETAARRRRPVPHHVLVLADVALRHQHLVLEVMRNRMRRGRTGS